MKMRRFPYSNSAMHWCGVCKIFSICNTASLSRITDQCDHTVDPSFPESKVRSGTL